MKQIGVVATAILFFLFATSYLYSQSTSVESIRNNPFSYNGHKVTVEGLVTQFVHDVGTTDYYLLKDDFGAIIKVNTADSAPETNKKYVVTGIVYVDQPTGRPFISEKSKTLKEETPVVQEIPTKKDNTLLYVLIGAVAVLIATYFIIRAIQSNKEASAVSYQSSYSPSSTVDYSAPTVKLNTHDMQSQSSDDFKTIKITNSSPKTLKFIPGKLTIVSGDDTGKSFKIAGYPTSEGSIVTIGREEVKGDRSYSHIQLLQKTISRKQAELVQKDGKLYVKNLSDTNPTQLDGIELKVNEKAELKANAVMRLGELEVKYEA